MLLHAPDLPEHLAVHGIAQQHLAELSDGLSEVEVLDRIKLWENLGRCGGEIHQPPKISPSWGTKVPQNGIGFLLASF